MQLAQRLYEGVDIGGETVGLITYMRTDGVEIAGEAVADIRNAISKRMVNPICHGCRGLHDEDPELTGSP